MHDILHGRILHLRAPTVTRIGRIILSLDDDADDEQGARMDSGSASSR